MVKKANNAVMNFIEEHMLDIIIVALIFAYIAVYNVLNDVVFPKSYPILERVVVIEK